MKVSDGLETIVKFFFWEIFYLLPDIGTLGWLHREKTENFSLEKSPALLWRNTGLVLRYMGLLLWVRYVNRAARHWSARIWEKKLKPHVGNWFQSSEVQHLTEIRPTNSIWSESSEKHPVLTKYRISTDTPLRTTNISAKNPFNIKDPCYYY